MNKKITIGVVAGLLVAIGGFFAYSHLDDGAKETVSSEASNGTSQTLTETEAIVARAMNRQGEPNVYIIDVRTKSEWNSGHIKDALFWDLDRILSGQMPPVKKNSEIYLYCHSGNRAGQAVKAMQSEGFNNVTNLGGYMSWVAAGGATESSLETE